MRSSKAPLFISIFAAVFLTLPATAAEIARETLVIRGLTVRVLDTNVEAQVDVPCAVRTQADSSDGSLKVVAELTGPGLTEPLHLETSAGGTFAVPGLSQVGTYLLQNIRVVRGSDVIAPTQPSVVTIQVANHMSTSVKVRQLTAQEIADRGIVVDSRNYDVLVGLPANQTNSLTSRRRRRRATPSSIYTMTRDASRASSIRLAALHRSPISTTRPRRRAVS
jgi:hypothetical protein